MGTRTAAVHRSEANHLAYVLEFLGSLIYVIAAVYVFASFGSYHALLSPLAMIQSVWLPFFYSAAIVGTALLFIASFTNLMKSRSLAVHKYIMAVTILTGLAWVGLTLGNLQLSLLVIIGFALSAIGGVYGLVDLLTC